MINDANQEMENQTSNQINNTQGRGFSIASMVLGITSLPLFCIPVLPGIMGVLGIIFAGIVLHRHYEGRGMAIAGLICSIVTTILQLITISGLITSIGALGAL